MLIGFKVQKQAFCSKYNCHIVLEVLIYCFINALIYFEQRIRILMIKIIRSCSFSGYCVISYDAHKTFLIANVIFKDGIYLMENIFTNLLRRTYHTHSVMGTKHFCYIILQHVCVSVRGPCLCINLVSYPANGTLTVLSCTLLFATYL